MSGKFSGKLFMRRENREKVWRSIPKEERWRYRRTSTRNQLLHPMYVDDYEEVTGHKLTAEDKGFGNNLYKTYFSVLYEIAEKIIMHFEFPDSLNEEDLKKLRKGI